MATQARVGPCQNGNSSPPPPLLRRLRYTIAETSPSEVPAGDHRQRQNAYRLAKTKDSRKIYGHSIKQWLAGWEAERSIGLKLNIALTTPLDKKKACIHIWLANNKIALAMQVCTTKIGALIFFHRQWEPTITSPAVHAALRSIEVQKEKYPITVLSAADMLVLI